MSNFFTKTDSQFQFDVLKDLKSDPSITSGEIGVTAQEGIVTLRGCVPHFFEKKSAEKAAQRIGGVRAVADEIEVKLMGEYVKSDAEIADAALNAISWDFMIPKKTQVSVDQGWVTLRGEATWNYQRKAAGRAVGHLMGVRGVTNEMSLSHNAESPDVQTRIEAALVRTARTDGKNIHVNVAGGRVTLTGKAHSFYDMADAGLAAWNTPGVTGVVNNLRF